MKQFVKQKFYGKLLRLLKFKRHKKIRTFISFNKKKLEVNPGIHFNYKKNEYFIKNIDTFYKKPMNLVNSETNSKTSLNSKEDVLLNSDEFKSNFFLKMKQQNKNHQENSNSRNSWQKLIKKKYKLNSFLFNLLCQYSRGRLKTILGKEFLSWYYTIPYKLSLSRFIGNKVLRSYYQNVSKKTLLNLHKKITKKAKRSHNLNVNYKSKSKNLIDLRNKKNVIKNLNFNLENRLDYTLLRLFQFKSLYTKKFILRDQQLSSNSKIIPNSVLTKDIHYSLKIKAPWKNFSSLQIKQKINHGHIYINNQKVTSPNIQLKFNDKIMIKGFVINPFWNNLSYNKGLLKGQNNTGISSLSKNSFLNKKNNIDIKKNTLILNTKISENLKKNLLYTFFFRNSNLFLSDSLSLYKKNCIEQQLLLEWQEKLNNNEFSLSEAFLLNNNEIENSNNSIQNQNLNYFLLSNYIKNLKIKRFSEIFYLTYKNFFLLPNCSIFFHESFLSKERINNLNFFFQRIGYNQSIYLLWSINCLLSSASRNSWNSEIKNNIIRNSRLKDNKNKMNSNSNIGRNKTVYTQNLIQKNLKDLLSLKNFQNKLIKSSKDQNMLIFNENSPVRASLIKKIGEESLNIEEKNNSNNILNNILLNHNQNPSWLFHKSLNCYASIVYGTRKCQWIQIQQQKNGGFYNKVYNKIQFFELELDFFQLAYRHYKKN